MNIKTIFDMSKHQTYLTRHNKYIDTSQHKKHKKVNKKIKMVNISIIFSCNSHDLHLHENYRFHKINIEK